MTTNIETLFVKVDTSEVNRGKDALGNFAKAGQAAEAQTNKLSASSLVAQSSIGRYAAAFANPTTAALAFGAAMVAVGVKSVQAAEEARLSIVKLELIYRNSGKNIGLTLKELEADIQSLAASSRFDDEDIRAGAIEFVKFGNIANNVLKSIMQTSVQYAAFTGTNVVQAASAMARAMADPEAASRLLKNAGVALTNTEQKYISTLMESGRMMEAQAIVARKLADTYAGTEKELRGLGSSYSTVTKEIGEAFEALGKTAPIQFISDAGLSALKMARNLVMDITAALGGEDTKNRFFGRLHPATKGIQDSIDAAAKAKGVGSDFTGGVTPSEARMKAEIDAAEATKKAVDGYAKTASASKEYVAALKLETEQIGLNAVQKRLMADAAEAAKAPTAALRVEIMKEAQSLAEATIVAEAAATATKLLSDSITGLADVGYKNVSSLQQQVDAQNQANAQIEMSQAQVLALVGAKELEEAANVRAAAQYAGPLHDAYIQYADDLEKAAGLQKELASGKQMAENARASSDYWSRLGSTIESTGRFAFISFAANGMKAMSSIKASFKMMMAEIAYQLAKKWVLNMVIGGGGGGMSGIASAFGGGGGGGGSLMDIGSGISSMYSALTGATGFSGALGSGITTLGSMFGSSALSSFGAGLAGSAAGVFSAAGGAGTAFIGGAGTAIGGAGMGAAASLGASLAALAGPLALAASAFMLALKLNGDKKFGGLSGWKATLVYGFLPAMFGRGPFKPIGPQELVGQFDSGGFEGDMQQQMRSKGGWFRKNRYRVAHTPLDGDTNEALSSVVAGASSIYSSLIQSSGESARSLAGWTYAVKRQIDSEEKVKQLITDVSDSIGKHLVPELLAVQQKGEQLADTAKRVRSEFILTTELVELTGQSFGALGLKSTVARDGLIQLLGGVEKAGPALQSYYQSFYTEAERTATGWRMLNQELTNLGLKVLPTTIEQYRALVESQDLSSIAGQGMFTALVQLAPAFAQLAASATSTRDRILALSSAQEAYLVEKQATSGTLLEYQRAVGAVMTANINSTSIPQFAVGTNSVPYDMTAQIHAGEEITPRPYVDIQRAARDETNMLLSRLPSEIRAMRVELNAALVSIALSTGDTAKRNRKWDGEGLPATRT
jgi:hypothetical protein